MKSRFTLIRIIVGALMLSGCNTDVRSVTWMTLDFPHGALRLVIQRDSDIRLFYGALPAYQAVKNGTFDIDEVFHQLQTRLHDVVPAENRPIGQPYGMATLEFSDGSKQDYLIYDGVFAEELFKVACANIVVEDEDFAGKILATECANLGGTTP
jgi:hypothetical protein